MLAKVSRCCSEYQITLPCSSNIVKYSRDAYLKKTKLSDRQFRRNAKRRTPITITERSWSIYTSRYHHVVRFDYIDTGMYAKCARDEWNTLRKGRAATNRICSNGTPQCSAENEVGDNYESRQFALAWEFSRCVTNDIFKQIFIWILVHFLVHMLICATQIYLNRS